MCDKCILAGIVVDEGFRALKERTGVTSPVDAGVHITKIVLQRIVAESGEQSVANFARAWGDLAAGIANLIKVED